MLYTGLAAFNGQQELIEFQDFLHGQLKFYGRYTVNDVYQEYPDQICESQTISGQDLDAVKLLSQLAPVRSSGFLTGNEFKVKSETDASDFQSQEVVHSGNLQHQPIDDSDIPGLVSNFLEDSEVFSPTDAGYA